MPTSFVHLRLHTEYSLEDSLIRVPTLIAAAKAQHLPALALTDQMNLFAAIKFYKSARNAGIKPILGIDVLLENEQSPTQPFHCTLLCRHFQGYQQLMQWVSEAYIQGNRKGQPMMKKTWFTQATTEGLIALSGGISGDIGQALITGRTQIAAQYLQEWKMLFPDRFYLELQRTHRPKEEAYITSACELASTYQIPVVATNDVRFLAATDFDAHEARVCIQQGYTLNDVNRPKHYSTAQYLRSSSEMATLFADIPSALLNTIEIAKRCNVTLPFDQVSLPHFPVPANTTAEAFLIQQAEEGLVARGITQASTDHCPVNTRVLSEVYHQRLKSELDVINTMGFAGYFLIVADFIRWAKKEQIPVGPGRGSGAGSLVAYALQITDLDPLYYDLLFERFLNPERVSMPDFDIDFCMENRDRVIEYVMERYGREAVAQIITFGTMAARAVVRDVGRVLGYPYGMVDNIAKLIPFEVGMTLEKALSKSADAQYSLKTRYEQEEEVKVLIDLARKLEGLARNAGTHAGGIVIAPDRLTQFTALYCEPGATHAVTQLDKDDIEAVGLVKFDFLGLRTLTIIHWAVTTINQQRTQQSKPALDINQLALDDTATLNLLRSCQVAAVFQLESRGIRGLLKRLSPTHFDDIVALLALFRPGPLQSGMVDDFINRKHQKISIHYPHPWLEPILKSTYGIILYQEQVMQIAQVLAGYTLGAADLLRRAMGKKKPEEMAKQRDFFMAGAQKKGVDQTIANSIFDLMEKFAGYGFNKSHSAAYALISWQTAWLKAHYPAEFMAAVLSSEMERSEKLASLLYECRSLKLTVNPPNINESEYRFTVNKQQQICYGLGAIKGVGKTFIENIIQARQTEGSFQDLFDFCRRVDPNTFKRRMVESMIYAGSFDVLCEDRARLIANLDLALRTAAQQTKVQTDKQADLFGIPLKTPELQTISASAWTSVDQQQKEKEVLGLYLSSHPLEQYTSEFSHLKFTALGALSSEGLKQRHLIIGWLLAFRLVLTARGDRFAILVLEDTTHRLELKLSHERYQDTKAYLIKDSPLLIDLETHRDKITMETRFNIHRVFDITQARQTWSGKLVIRLEKETASLKLIDDLEHLLKTAAKGTCPIIIEYHSPMASVQLKLAEDWCIQPNEALLAELCQYFQEKNVQIAYAGH